MKTKEFIKLLQDADPEGECDVVVNNNPIYFIYQVPWYYDGRCQYVEFDENKKPIVAGWRSTVPYKIKIVTTDIEDLLWDYPNLKVDFSGLNKNDIKNVQKSLDEIRIRSNQHKLLLKDEKIISDHEILKIGSNK